MAKCYGHIRPFIVSLIPLCNFLPIQLVRSYGFRSMRSKSLRERFQTKQCITIAIETQWDLIKWIREFCVSDFKYYLTIPNCTDLWYGSRMNCIRLSPFLWSVVGQRNVVFLLLNWTIDSPQDCRLALNLNKPHHAIGLFDLRSLLSSQTRLTYTLSNRMNRLIECSRPNSLGPIGRLVVTFKVDFLLPISRKMDD